jgi:predicted Zn-dependent protease with MMP-like domain
MRLSRERFEELTFEIAEAVLAQLPPDLRADAETVLLEIADWPTAEQASGDEAYGLLGLYEGTPLVERHVDAIYWEPDRITLFQEPLQDLAETEAELRAHIRTTLIHELGHFFGFDEDELETRGWG